MLGEEVGSGVGLPKTYVGPKVGAEVGAGVALPGKYVGSTEGSAVGDADGTTDGAGVGLPTV